MKITNDDIYDALITIRTACDERVCRDCPMYHKNSNGSVCGVRRCDPMNWEFGNPPGDWRAFREED